MYEQKYKKASCKIKTSLVKIACENFENKSKILTGNKNPSAKIITIKIPYTNKKKFIKLLESCSFLLLKNMACGIKTLPFKDVKKAPTNPPIVRI